MQDQRSFPLPLERHDLLSLLLLAAATAVAWFGLAKGALLPFLGGWSLMMAAMMLPSIAPLVLLVRGNRIALAAGYLTMWAVTGFLPWAAMQWSIHAAPWIVLAIAGLYELTPFKHTCLRHCTNPATFLMEHYKSGPFMLGIEHGIWCVGCCAGLMAVLVLAGSMSMMWAAGIAAVVFVQKVLPWPFVSARVTGVALLVGALVSVL